MTEQSTLLTLLLVRLDIDHLRTSTNACRWTAVDVDSSIILRFVLNLATGATSLR